MPKKILIVEDEQDIRELYAEILRDEGLEVHEAWEGEKGLAECLSGKYDLILLDIMLPKVDGLQILKAMRKKQELAKIPVILLTNLSTDNVIKEGFALGANSYIIKSEMTPAQIVAEAKKAIFPTKPQELLKESP